MTVAVGDVVVPAAIFPFNSVSTAAQNLAAGLVVDAPVFGVVSDILGSPEMRVDWNTSRASGVGISTYTTTDISTTPNDSLRFVDLALDATVAAFRGKVVQLDSASPEFRGLVVAVFALETATTGKSGDGSVVTTEVVLFRTRTGEYVLADATAVSVVTGE